MKILIRIMGITIAAIFIIVGIIYLVNTNIIINELNNCSALAMKQTQELMKEKIIAQLNMKPSDVFNEIAYEDYYIKCFNETVINKDLYDLYVEADDTKGIIYVKIEVPRYKFIPVKKLLHIIDVKGEGLDDIESLYYEKSTKIQKTRIGMTSANFNPQVLKSWYSENGDLRVFTGFDISVYATNGSSSDARSIVGPLAEVRCIDENDDIHVLSRAEAGEFKQTKLSSNEKCSCKLLELVLPEGVIPSKYSIRTDNVVVVYRTSYINEEVTTMVKKNDYLLSEHVDIDLRYIDNKRKLTSNSIWLQDIVYTNTLDYFIEKLYEKTN